MPAVLSRWVFCEACGGKTDPACPKCHGHQGYFVPFGLPPTKYAGADWLPRRLRRHAAGEPKISPLGLLVADILGQVYRGIYHIDYGITLTKPDWSDENFIEVNVPQGLATYDGNELTALVIEAHEAPVRLEINAGGPRRLKLGFSPRSRKAVELWGRHPTIEQAVQEWRATRGLDPRS